jgi:hypothetical protein
VTPSSGKDERKKATESVSADRVLSTMEADERTPVQGAVKLWPPENGKVSTSTKGRDPVGDASVPGPVVVPGVQSCADAGRVKPAHAARARRERSRI